ncbi:MAG: alkaline phosphatase family protein [Rhodospirillales bacterium]|nr:MAG: alkaline phosphatase family protein [Rhodospirillales bacterium]
MFDGLRPDMVDAATMPNLHAFQDRHCRFARARCVFPSETRVNAAALVTGCQPARAGVVGNQFHAGDVFADRWVRTAERDDLVAVDAAWNGRLIDAPTLGERLAAAGLTYAVVATGSTGATWLLAHRAEALGQLRWSAHGAAHSASRAMWDGIEARFGPPPPGGVPASARVAHATSIYLDHVLPRIDPDVAVLWYTDPDNSYHYAGIGSAAARESLVAADSAFGRVVEAWERAPDQDRRTIIVVSDHGQVTNRGRIDLVGAFAGSGFSVDTRAVGNADLGLVPGSASAVTFRRDDPGLRRAVAEWVAEQAWSGALFSAGPDRDAGALDGTFNRALVGLDSGRVADLVFTFAHDDAVGGGGWPGGAPHDSALADGHGNHGGLHPREMGNYLAIGGARFRGGYVSPCPAGIVDIAPTILHLLGLPHGGCDGRVLHEAFVDGATPVWEAHALDLVVGGATRRLSLSRVVGTLYVDGGGRVAP